MKNKIARDRRSNALNENIKKSQQAIKFFEILLSKIFIRQRLNSLWNLKSLFSLPPLREEIRKKNSDQIFCLLSSLRKWLKECQSSNFIKNIEDLKHKFYELI